MPGIYLALGPHNAEDEGSSPSLTTNRNKALPAKILFFLLCHVPFCDSILWVRLC